MNNGFLGVGVRLLGYYKVYHGSVWRTERSTLRLRTVFEGDTFVEFKHRGRRSWSRRVGNTSLV